MKKIILFILACIFSLFILACTSKVDQEKIDNVISYIDFLPSKIKESDIDDINYVENLYNELNDYEKELVTNVDTLKLLLEKRECLLNEEDLLTNEFDVILKTLDESIPSIIDSETYSVDLLRRYEYKNAYSSYIYQIVWTSSSEEAIDLTGNVFHRRSDSDVTLSAKIYTTKISVTKEFKKTIKVLKSSSYQFDKNLAVAYWYGAYTPLTDIDMQTLDIINYSFAQITEDVTGSVKTYGIDVSDLVSISKITEVKEKGIKVCISLGGWHDDMSFWDTYSRAASTDESRKQVANAILKVLQEYNLDGVDMDWEYPSSSDVTNFTLLMQEINTTLKKANKNYIVSAAIPTGSTATRRFDLASLDSCLDLFYIMTYDLDGSRTSHLTSLKSCKDAVKLFTDNGVSQEKIVIGAAFYARCFCGVTNADNLLNQSCMYKATIKYDEVVSSYLSKLGTDVTKYYDGASEAYYLYDSVKNNYITYEDPLSLKAKWAYVKENDLAGLMYWSYNDDNTQILMKAFYEAKYGE